MVKKYTTVKELVGIGLGITPENNSEIINLKKKVEELEQQIEVLRRDLDLRTLVNHEHHARIYEEIEKQHTTNITIKNTDSIIEIIDLIKYLPDLKRLHKQNLEKASDVSLE